jgi:16S rRNA (guanine966-N2)-methyltransferase
VNQTVRIIGGQYRGKKLHFPGHTELRPTPDRVRETLFNWLMHRIRNARCLDAFAGSGALGFEAYSRGASQVILLEHHPLVFSHLKKIAASFETPQLKVLQTDACDYLKQTQEQFDLVFLDPPFSKNYLLPCLQSLAGSDILIPEGWVYVESPQEIELDSQVWRTLKIKRAGQVTYGLYEKLGSIFKP